MKAYPEDDVIFYVVDTPDTKIPVTLFGREKSGFILGYEQAEKDLALTWEDIRTIIQILTKGDWYDFEISDKLWSKEFYEEVLRRYKKQKEEEQWDTK